MNVSHARYVGVVAAFVLALGTLGPSRQSVLAQDGTKQAPIFEVDPFWPKPLPNHWVTGSTIGLSVDAQDNVWTIHRPNTVEANFKAADIKVGEKAAGTTRPRRGPRARRRPPPPTRPSSASAARWPRRCLSTTRPGTW